ncbi:hypothetical protein HY988_02045 [Candidatus Micrarchaeota archaeon]|nr:hypothetical protein [Candidatus Micrarchaeota archaeon]
MAEDFVGMSVAIVVVTASIILAGIILGVGRAFGYKKIEHFGIEEIIQSIINAAIIGSFAAIIALVGGVSSALVTSACAPGTSVEQLLCALGNANSSLFLSFMQLTKTLNLLGYYQTISLNFGSFSIAPFTNLSSVSGALSLQLLAFNLLNILFGLNFQIATFIKQSALSILFPVGLVLRTFFATRRVGGFLIALALGLYLFYPTFILIFPDPQPELNSSSILMQNFTNSSFYAAIPIVDLNSNYAIAGKLDIMSGRCQQNLSNSSFCPNVTQSFFGNSTLLINGTNSTNPGNGSNSTNVSVIPPFVPDFNGDITMLSQANSNAISKSILYAIFAPLFSLAITFIFVKELGSILGGEIGIKTFSAL